MTILGILLDGIVILLFIIFVYDGFKRGVVKSAIDLIGALIALFLSYYMATQFSQIIFDSFIRQNLIESISKALNETSGKDVNTQVEAIFLSLPKYISNTLGFYGVTPHTINTTISSSVGNATEQVLSNISPVVINLIRSVLVSVLFVLLLSLVGVISRALNRAFRLPLLKQINEIAGAVFGVLKCVIILLVITLVLRVFIPTLSNVPDILSESTIDSTYIFKFIYNNNPLYSLLHSLGI